MKTYAAIILLTNNLMVWENSHAIMLSGKKQKLHIYYGISNTLKSVHISEVRFKSPQTLSSTLPTQIKNPWNTNPTLFYPTWKKWLFLAWEFKRSMYFYTCILHILYILSFWDFAEQMGFVQKSNIILITFFYYKVSAQCCINPKSYLQSMIFGNIN